MTDPARPWSAGRTAATEEADVLHRWRTLKQDTSLISALTGIPQPRICRIIAADQDRRHALKLSEPRA